MSKLEQEFYEAMIRMAESIEELKEEIKKIGGKYEELGNVKRENQSTE